MASLLRRLSRWWNKDALEVATEDARDDDPVRRDAEREGRDAYETRKADRSAARFELTADYERDSEPPVDPAP